ncbi:hypothetical protein D3C83_119190 [compost metagenome]
MHDYMVVAIVAAGWALLLKGVWRLGIDEWMQSTLEGLLEHDRKQNEAAERKALAG